MKDIVHLYLVKLDIYLLINSCWSA